VTDGPVPRREPPEQHDDMSDSPVDGMTFGSGVSMQMYADNGRIELWTHPPQGVPEGIGKDLSTAVLVLSAAEGFELAAAIRHTAEHAAAKAGLCTGCGCEQHDDDETDDDTRWGDTEFLANASDHLDHILVGLRENHAGGATWTTAQIAEVLIDSNDEFLDDDDSPFNAEQLLLDAVSRLCATAIQRLVTG
jgi:hypothetical protein